MEKNVVCNTCGVAWYIKCGKCGSILEYFGQKHGCPNNDEGFFDDCDDSVTICNNCEKLNNIVLQKCICCGEQNIHQLCVTCTEMIWNDIENDDMTIPQQ